MWKDENKKIINISSMSSEGIKKYIHPYAIHKKALDSAFDQIVSQKSKCKIINIKPSWIDTPSVKTVDAEKMCPKKLSNFIYDLSNIDLNIREVKIEV
jgi:NAD(P)-dependent dehydrogenase (short-subunit alcohol dehydrogenase family)